MTAAKIYNIVRQHDQSDCGVAYLLSLIQHYGGNGSIEQLRKQSDTSQQGTTLLGLYQAAQASGFDTEGCEGDIPVLIEHGHPVILHVVMEGNLHHYVVCYGYEYGRFVIGDPAKGIVLLTEQEIDEIWRSRICLTLAPNEKFKTQTAIKSNKKK
jgi:ATP-binding cassette subfamily B protein